MAKYHFERALFVIGDQNDGKTTQLKSMYLDPRFGLGGKIPRRAPLRPIWLSRERKVVVRFSSPHERGQDPKTFHQSLHEEFIQLGGRVSLASALQLKPRRNDEMPDAVETVRKFMMRFGPERVRVAILQPEQQPIGATPKWTWIEQSTAKFWAMGVECSTIDARSKDANGLMLADFFDFT